MILRVGLQGMCCQACTFVHWISSFPHISPSSEPTVPQCQRHMERFNILLQDDSRLSQTGHTTSVHCVDGRWLKTGRLTCFKYWLIYWYFFFIVLHMTVFNTQSDSRPIYKTTKKESLMKMCSFTILHYQKVCFRKVANKCIPQPFIETGSHKAVLCLKHLPTILIKRRQHHRQSVHSVWRMLLGIAYSVLGFQVHVWKGADVKKRKKNAMVQPSWKFGEREREWERERERERETEREREKEREWSCP